jgi:4-amino-4-deoxychorismate lyase
MRLNWIRGSAPAREIDLSADGEPPLLHRFWLQFTPLQPSFRPVTVWISQLERRKGASMLSQCKTFAYGQAIQARCETLGPAGQRIFNPDGVNSLAESFWLSLLRAG